VALSDESGWESLLISLLVSKALAPPFSACYVVLDEIVCDKLINNSCFFIRLFFELMIDYDICPKLMFEANFVRLHKLLFENSNNERMIFRLQLESSQVSWKLSLFFAIPLCFYDVILWFLLEGYL